MHAPAQMDVEPHVEDRRARCLRQLQLDGDRRRGRLVALPAEHERLELDVERLASGPRRAKAKRSQIDRGHPEGNAEAP